MMIDGDTIEDPNYEYLRGYALELFSDEESAFWVTVDANCAEDFLAGVNRGKHAKDHMAGGRRVRPYYYAHREALYEWFRGWFLAYHAVEFNNYEFPKCEGCKQAIRLGQKEGFGLLRQEFLAQGGVTH
jgi:hypothetical protein